jgi:hypothetical protein
MYPPEDESNVKVKMRAMRKRERRESALVNNWQAKWCDTKSTLAHAVRLLEAP